MKPCLSSRHNWATIESDSNRIPYNLAAPQSLLDTAYILLFHRNVCFCNLEFLDQLHGWKCLVFDCWWIWCSIRVFTWYQAICGYGCWPVIPKFPPWSSWSCICAWAREFCGKSPNWKKHTLNFPNPCKPDSSIAWTFTGSPRRVAADLFPVNGGAFCRNSQFGEWHASALCCLELHPHPLN